VEDGAIRQKSLGTRDVVLAERGPEVVCQVLG
jgi:hypothetical protein